MESASELSLCTLNFAEMIHSQPKSATLTALGIFLILILGVSLWLFYELICSPESFFILKLILAPLLLVIAIIVATKGYLTAVTVWLGDNQIAYRYPFGSQIKLKLSAIAHWEESVVKRKKSVYRSLTIVLTNGKKLQVSNHENTHYDQLLSYLKKKVKVRQPATLRPE